MVYSPHSVRPRRTSLSIEMEREMSVIKEKLRLPPLQIAGEEARW